MNLVIQLQLGGLANIGALAAHIIDLAILCQTTPALGALIGAGILLAGDQIALNIQNMEPAAPGFTAGHLGCGAHTGDHAVLGKFQTHALGCYCINGIGYRQIPGVQLHMLAIEAEGIGKATQRIQFTGGLLGGIIVKPLGVPIHIPHLEGIHGIKATHLAAFICQRQDLTALFQGAGHTAKQAAAFIHQIDRGGIGQSQGLGQTCTGTGGVALDGEAIHALDIVILCHDGIAHLLGCEDFLYHALLVHTQTHDLHGVYVLDQGFIGNRNIYLLPVHQKTDIVIILSGETDLPDGGIGIFLHIPV